MKLYTGNLSFETTENDLQDLFEQHGREDHCHRLWALTVLDSAARRLLTEGLA